MVSALPGGKGATRTPNGRRTPLPRASRANSAHRSNFLRQSALHCAPRLDLFCRACALRAAAAMRRTAGTADPARPNVSTGNTHRPIPAYVTLCPLCCSRPLSPYIGLYQPTSTCTAYISKI